MAIRAETISARVGTETRQTLSSRCVRYVPSPSTDPRSDVAGPKRERRGATRWTKQAKYGTLSASVVSCHVCGLRSAYDTNASTSTRRGIPAGSRPPPHRSGLCAVRGPVAHVRRNARPPIFPCSRQGGQIPSTKHTKHTPAGLRRSSKLQTQTNISTHETRVCRHLHLSCPAAAVSYSLSRVHRQHCAGRDPPPARVPTTQPERKVAQEHPTNPCATFPIPP